MDEQAGLLDGQEIQDGIPGGLPAFVARDLPGHEPQACQAQNHQNPAQRVWQVAHQGSQIERSITAEPSDLLTMAREILDQVEWQLIELHLIQELSLRDAARKIGIGRETARASYHAALVKLKTKLETQDNGKKVSRG